MVKILFLGHSLVARRQWSFIYALVDAGAEVVFFPPLNWGKNKYEGSNLHCLPVDHLKGNLYSYRYGIDWLKDKIDTFEPDWIGGFVEPYSMAAMEIEAVAKSKNVKTFYFAYENLSHNLMRMPEPLRKNLSIVEQANQILCGNSPALSFMKHYGAVNPVKIPHTGVETDIFKLYEERPVNGKKECVFIGRDVPEKNWKLVEEMMKNDKTIEVARPNGFIADKDMGHFYNKGKVLLHTSLRIPTWKEQLGYVVAEALACELSVIHSVQGDNMGWFANLPGTELADPTNSWDYSEKIEKLQDQYPNKKGREWILNNFSNKVIAREWLEVLK